MFVTLRVNTKALGDRNVLFNFTLSHLFGTVRLRHSASLVFLPLSKQDTVKTVTCSVTVLNYLFTAMSPPPPIPHPVQRVCVCVCVCVCAFYVSCKYCCNTHGSYINPLHYYYYYLNTSVEFELERLGRKRQQQQ